MRKQIINVESWRFSGSVDSDEILGKNVPKSLVIFLRWLIQGPSKLTKDDDSVDDQVQKRALTLAQHAMYACLTRKQQRDNKKTLTLQHSNEWPLQMSVGLTVHSTFRSKELIDFLHGLCLSVDFRRIIAVETQLANQAIVSMYEMKASLFLETSLQEGTYSLLSTTVTFKKILQIVKIHCMVLS